MISFQRQLDIFNPSNYQSKKLTIIGCGGIGSFTTLALAKLGLNQIIVYDGDIVEAHNLPNQLYKLNSVGKPKVEALREIVSEMTGVDIDARYRYWTPSEPLSGIVISAVDHMEALPETQNLSGRMELWNSIKNSLSVELFVDARLGGEQVRVLAIRPLKDILYQREFEKNFFPQAQAAQLPCTAQAIIDVGFLVASLIVEVIRSYLTKNTFRRDIIIDVSDGYPRILVLGSAAV